jgi:hypothetical protein
MEQDLADKIEKLMDDYGAATFLSMASFVAGEKAEHTATQWQDTPRAKAWMEISRILDKLTARAEEWNL